MKGVSEKGDSRSPVKYLTFEITIAGHYSLGMSAKLHQSFTFSLNCLAGITWLF